MQAKKAKALAVLGEYGSVHVTPRRGLVKLCQKNFYQEFYKHFISTLKSCIQSKNTLKYYTFLLSSELDQPQHIQY